MGFIMTEGASATPEQIQDQIASEANQIAAILELQMLKNHTLFQ